MSETKIEWVLQFLPRSGKFKDQESYQSEALAKSDAKELTNNAPTAVYRLIKRTTVTTEEVIA